MLCYLGTHDGHLARRPHIVHVTTQMFRRHHVVRTAVCLACNDRDLGHSSLGVRVQQFRTVFDNATVFLNGRFKQLSLNSRFTHLRRAG
jgi:hypothetical protein